MKSDFKAAIKYFGSSDEPFASRWMLPDGEWLGVHDLDHRVVGNFCKESWLDFISDGACSVHFEASANYLWIRTCGISSGQKQAFTDLFEAFDIKSITLKVDLYEETKFQKSLEFGEEELGFLWLTDRIAYNMQIRYINEYSSF